MTAAAVFGLNLSRNQSRGVELISHKFVLTNLKHLKLIGPFPMPKTYWGYVTNAICIIDKSVLNGWCEQYKRCLPLLSNPFPGTNFSLAWPGSPDQTFKEFLS